MDNQANEYMNEQITEFKKSLSKTNVKIILRTKNPGCTSQIKAKNLKYFV